MLVYIYNVMNFRKLIFFLINVIFLCILKIYNIILKNRQLGLDLVPRLNNEVVDPDSLSPIELHQVVRLSLKNLQFNYLFSINFFVGNKM